MIDGLKEIKKLTVEEIIYNTVENIFLYIIKQKLISEEKGVKMSFDFIKSGKCFEMQKLNKHHRESIKVFMEEMSLAYQIKKVTKDTPIQSRYWNKDFRLLAIKISLNENF